MEVNKQEIVRWVREGHTHSRISNFLKSHHPGERGFSERSVRRFCDLHGIHYQSGLTERQLDHVVGKAVHCVGHSYGRKTMQGLLKSQGINVGQNRISHSLMRVAPGPMRGRQINIHQHLNPAPYHALYYGEKLHMDQNEKLNRFGVTHVLAIDGFSRKIVGLITIPRKNAIGIYNALMRPLLLIEGLWEQVRVDHGMEFVLVVAIQQHLASLRHHHHHVPALQTMSTSNHRVERIWVEINQRINYPIKRILVAMEGSDDIDMSNDIVQFCVSWTTINTIAFALRRFVLAWNHHRIPGNSGGVPNLLASTHRNTTQVSTLNIPSTDNAIHLFTSAGGHLTPESTFGSDPLEGYPHLQYLRERDFRATYPNMDAIFHNVVTSDGTIFRQSIHCFIQLKKRFSSLVM